MNVMMKKAGLLKHLDLKICLSKIPLLGDILF